eukprot:7883850-Alexandrium_andersonii.AAC.1
MVTSGDGFPHHWASGFPGSGSTVRVCSMVDGVVVGVLRVGPGGAGCELSLIHISEPTRLALI